MSVHWNHFILSLTALLCISVALCMGQVTSRTFFGNDSYVRLQRWNPSPQRLLRFTFRTSEQNGLLLFTMSPEGSTREDYLLIRLVKGSLVIDVELGNILTSETESLGKNLNDNQPHTVTILHDPDIYLFEYKLDSGRPVEETYASNIIPDFGSNGVFIGGVPFGTTLFANETYFIGCLENVISASSSNLIIDMDSSSLQALPVVESRGRIQNSCIDPCTTVMCGSGTCVTKWPDRAFCNCRGTGMLGESCSEGK